MDYFEFLDDEIYPGNEQTETKEEWRITNDSAADWAVEKIKAEKDELDRIESIAQEKIERINEMLEIERQKYQNKTGFLKSKLAEYFETVERKSTKTQESYQLLSGKLVKKLGGFKPSYEDTELLNYLKNDGLTDYIEVTEKPAWGEYKKRLVLTETGAIDTETGETIDVIKVERQLDTFDVKF